MVAERGGRRKNKTRVGLSLRDEEKLKNRLRVTYPSEPWVDHTIKRFEDVKADGTTIVYRFHDAKAFPPPAESTPMVKCGECGRIVPPNSLETQWPKPRDGEAVEWCMDHQPARLQNAYGSSPSAHAIQMVQHYKLRVETVKLKRESRKALQREIDRFKSRQWEKLA